MDKQKNPNQEIWSRVFSDDFAAGLLSPLFFSYVKTIFGETKVKYYQGYVYTSLELFESLIKIPYFPKHLREYLLLTYYPDFLHKQILNSSYKPIKRRLFYFILGILKPSLIKGRIVKSYSRFEKKYKSYLDFFDKKIQNNLTFEEILKLDKELDKKFKPHWLISFGGGIQCIFAVSQLHYHLDKYYNDTSLVAPLLSGIKSRTNLSNQEIQHLAQLLKKDPKFQQKKSEISLDVTSKNFLDAFNNFLKKHGHRGYYREVLYPTWGENPDRLFKTIVSIATYDQKLSKKNIKDDFEKAKNKIKKLPDKIQKEIMHWLNLGRQFIKFREDERYTLDVHLSRKRKLYIKIAEKLVKEKQLENIDDIFYLDFQTVLRLLDKSQSSVSDTVKKARIDYAKYKYQLPPKFLLKDKSKYDDSTIKTEFIGNPASGGKIVGKACIILTPDELYKIQPNDILLTRFTDPGWTSCFHIILGLVTEVGGILSHGAIISREYGIPAVTGVKDILNHVSTGDIIMVDGNNGIVTFAKK